jgi:hypothetical protein
LRPKSAYEDRCETAGECEASLRGVCTGELMVLEMAEEEAVFVLDRSKGLGRLLVRVELDCDCDCGSADDEAALGIDA